jgi:hypothetical protein
LSRPPFLAGQHAFATGEALEANPHTKGAPFKPDEYPGPHKNWHDGWIHARSVRDFTKADGTRREPHA